jgi:RND family efflux transporter MFP subunit
MMIRSIRWLGGLLAGFLCTTCPAAEDQRIAVTTTRLAQVAQPIERSALAEVVALARTSVRARLAAEITSVNVEVGEQVQAGQVVVELDCVDAQDRLERTQARLSELEARRELARSRLERTRRLRRQDAASEDRLDEARSEDDAVSASLRSQRAQVATARRDVERCTIEAPFAGSITARPGQPGTFIDAGTPVVELIDPERVVLSGRIGGPDVASLRQAPEPRFHAGGDTYPVDLAHVADAADSASRLREARLRFTDTQPVAGDAGRLHWQAVAKAVPADYVVRRDGRLGVMIVDAGRARFRALSEAIEGRPAPTDLPGPTRLIVRGRSSVADGADVRVTE